MRIYVALVSLYSLFACSTPPGQTDLSGIYVSKAPKLNDVVSIMYIRGYTRYLYFPTGSIKLEVNKDNTFCYYINNAAHCGTWTIEEKHVVARYTDSLRHDARFNIRKNRLYRINETTLCESGKKMKHLLLLEKQ